jgi:hypothetical protein
MTPFHFHNKDIHVSNVVPGWQTTHRGISLYTLYETTKRKRKDATEHSPLQHLDTRRSSTIILVHSVK